MSFLDKTGLARLWANVLAIVPTKTSQLENDKQYITADEIETTINDLNGKPIEKVLLYYGYPIAINNVWNVEDAVSIYQTYDIVIFGDTYQNPTHSEYESTVAIIQKLAEVAPEVRVVGYVPIGLHPDWINSNLPMEELKNRVNQWNAIGVHGIFLDEFGYDYYVTRERQNEIVGYCHDLGKFVFANSWSIDYCFSKEPMEMDWMEGFSPNPNGISPLLNENDYYLYENLFYSTEKLDDGTYELECASVWRIEDVLRYYTTPQIDGKSYYEVYGTKVCSLDGIPSAYSKTQQDIMKSISIIGASILNITAIAFGDEHWGSTGNFEQWNIPDLNLNRNKLNRVTVERKSYTKEDGTESVFPYKWTTNINGRFYSIVFDIPDPEHRTWVDGMRYATMDDTIIENAWTNMFTFQSDVRLAQETAETAISNAEEAISTVNEIKTEIEETIPTLIEAEAQINALVNEATAKIDDATTQLEAGLADLEALTSGFDFKEVQW